MWKKFATGEWVIDHTTAYQRRVVLLRDALWFVGFMSLYAIWITHLARWAAETPVEAEADEFDAL